ncbi:hypothetical protein I5907_21305 [Panacibacter sp. DH6]|uniref:Uncharacterized protein n=1 Tax=Panacibacter microcysteis TaxID=2793269 RepID=A0A931H0K8_9BACT|nr:hypothetical protein [Panacibacter microcysteis]MBG9378784.1 hypothetical protein [Panacibacter microcysteis]
MSGSIVIHVQGKELQIFPQDETDQVTYLIQEGNNVITVIGLNEDAEWEATTDIAPAFVKAVGNKIEQVYM